MVNPTWEERDLPVLRAIVEMSDEGAWIIEPDEIAERVGFDEAKVKSALFALAAEYPPFFSYKDLTTYGGRDIGFISQPTGHARRTVGTWPTPESLADRLVQAMSEAADKEPDEEKRGRLKTAASWFGNAGRDVLVDVTAAVVNRQMGGA
ncbi:hypothetical protein U2F26_23925 [Micromonospora sp. 4G57]|uniref:Uncharacterized protein n=1 Tax=Micromonospora sicca TaxID=2202420 RepID=A0ABU5JGD5_9ACTN|nr:MULTISPECIES: hypothetical protein [unclassified Micromonospora]MDZ5445742.1 hypothetical protein [Micromonospora sp. 4G57]MDZ5491656.1 hypothetical protein [Micromonospora sp. 4G53]